MARRDTLLLVTASVATLLFLVLAVLVPRGVFGDLDAAIMIAAHDFATPLRTHVITAITQLGWAPFLIPLIAVVATWAAIAGDRRAALVLVTVSIADAITNDLLKESFQRDRPELWPRMEMSSFSFPSGHAMTAVAIYGTLAMVLVRLVPRSRTPTLFLAPLVAISIGLSRIYLGVHWPSDVLAGWAAGTVLLVSAALALIRWPWVRGLPT